MSQLPAGTLSAVAALVPLLAGTGAGLLALTGVRRLESPSLVLQVLAAAAWLLLDGPLEGPVLLSFGPDHGLTLGDLVALPAALLVACLLVLRAQREHHAAPGRPSRAPGSWRT